MLEVEIPNEVRPLFEEWMRCLSKERARANKAEWNLREARNNCERKIAAERAKLDHQIGKHRAQVVKVQRRENDQISKYAHETQKAYAVYHSYLKGMRGRGEISNEEYEGLIQEALVSGN